MLLQKNYKTSLTEELLATNTWEVEIKLLNESASDTGYVLIEPWVTNKEETAFFHRKSWTSVFCYWVNRDNPTTHNIWASVYLAANIDILNHLLSFIWEQWMILKKSLSNVIIKWWIFYIDSTNVTINDCDTSLLAINKILTVNSTNYIYIKDQDYFITTTQDNTLYLVWIVIVWADWNITSITKSNIYWIWTKWEKWDKWDQWETWAKWDKWDKWDTGTTWATGATWATWAQWLKWDKWDKWDTGATWDTWEQWIQWNIWNWIDNITRTSWDGSAWTTDIYTITYTDTTTDTFTVYNWNDWAWSWDMLKSTYDTANKNSQIAIDSEVVKLTWDQTKSWKLTLTPSSSVWAKFNVWWVWVAPSSPIDWDMWITWSSLSVRCWTSTRVLWSTWNLTTVSQAEAEAWTLTTVRWFTPERVKQAIEYNITWKANLSWATFTWDVVVPEEAYWAGWNWSNEVPTKNDIYDKIETLGSWWKFWWTWADWVLNISSWTTTLTLSSDFLVKNYESINISWTALLDITWVSWNNWAIAIIRCKWDFTMSAWTIAMDWQWWQWWNWWSSWYSWNSWYQWYNNQLVVKTNYWTWWIWSPSTQWTWWAWVTISPINEITKYLYKGYVLQCWAWWWEWWRSPAWTWLWWDWWRWGWILIIEVWWNLNFSWWTIRCNWNNWVTQWASWTNWWWWGGWWWWGSFIICYNWLVDNSWTKQCNWWNWWSANAYWSVSWWWGWWWGYSSWWNWQIAWTSNSYWSWWTSWINSTWWWWWAWYYEVIKNTEFA